MYSILPELIKMIIHSSSWILAKRHDDSLHNNESRNHFENIKEIEHKLVSKSGDGGMFGWLKSLYCQNPRPFILKRQQNNSKTIGSLQENIIKVKGGLTEILQE